LNSPQALFDTLAATSPDYNARRGVYVDCRDKHGRTPLILACYKGRYSVVELMISLGAQVDATYGAGLTALHVAVAYRRTAIATLLVHSGASPFVENLAGLTAVDMVVRSGVSLELLRLMESRGLYVGWVEQRVGRYRRPWARRWAVITQRLRYTGNRGDPRVRVVLSLYSSELSSFGSSCMMWVDGSRATGAGTLVELELAPGHQKPKGAHCRRANGSGWVLEFRAAGTDVESRQMLQDFMSCLNWGSSLGTSPSLGQVPMVHVPVTASGLDVGRQQQQQQALEDHWAHAPPGFLTGPEISGLSLTSTATNNSQDNELIPVSYETAFQTPPLPAAAAAPPPARNDDDRMTSDASGEWSSREQRECLICMDNPVEVVFCHTDGSLNGQTGCAVACSDCNARRPITSRVKVFGL
jgi:hypothetical protein